MPIEYEQLLKNYQKKKLHDAEIQIDKLMSRILSNASNFGFFKNDGESRISIASSVSNAQLSGTSVNPSLVKPKC